MEKKVFGLTDIGKGRKCYEVLQGIDAPCPFCTNQFLNCETFYTWELTNPISHRHYLLRDKLIRWNGRLARLEFAVDITEKENISQAVQRKLDIESTLLECIRILNREENFPQAVGMVLENLGMMHQADRAYIFEYSVLKNGGLIANNTYEWCSEGIFPQKEVLQNVPISYMSCWQKMFERREDVVIDNLESIRDSDLDMYSVLKPQGIESLIVVPLVLNDVISGFIGVDNPKANRDDHSLLHSLAYFVTNEQRKRNMQSELKRMSYCDDLTGLHNRNSYISVLQKLEKIPGFARRRFCGSQWVKAHQRSARARLRRQIHPGHQPDIQPLFQGRRSFPYWRRRICLPLPEHSGAGLLCEDRRAPTGGQ